MTAPFLRALRALTFLTGAADGAGASLSSRLRLVVLVVLAAALDVAGAAFGAAFADALVAFLAGAALVVFLAAAAFGAALVAFLAGSAFGADFGASVALAVRFDFTRVPALGLLFLAEGAAVAFAFLAGAACVGSSSSSRLRLEP